MAKTRQIQDLKEQAEHLSRISPEKEEEIMQSTDAVAKNFDKIKGKYLFTYKYFENFYTYSHCKFQRLFLFLSLLHKDLIYNIFSPSFFGRWGKIENAFYKGLLETFFKKYNFL